VLLRRSTVPKRAQVTALPVFGSFFREYSRYGHRPVYESPEPLPSKLPRVISSGADAWYAWMFYDWPANIWDTDQNLCTCGRGYKFSNHLCSLSARRLSCHRSEKDAGELGMLVLASV
jgi:hypothetical protein